jgi:2-oxoisovalerate dehydrogenase E1 component
MTNPTPPTRPIPAGGANAAADFLARMAFIRAFEAKVQALSQTNPPTIAGSVHLCAGQEAVPLGAIAGLRDDDQIIATYRGHGWALASGLDPVGVMAELCQRSGGINGGRAGSALMMGPGTRFIGENSIVGAGTTIACGVALSNLAQKNGRVVTVTIGDGAMNQGSVHEAMAFAAARKLPVIFVVENNGWSELTATSDMFLIERLAQRANGYGMPSATIDGTDPFAVRDSFALAAERARSGEGPVLIECRVPRLWGHYNRDIEHYRSKADKAEAAARDPITLMSERMRASGVMPDANLTALVAQQTDAIEEVASSALASAVPSPSSATEHVVSTASGTQVSDVVETREMSYIEAVNLALRTELQNDSRVVLYGEDVGKGGGIFGGSRYLQRDFGADRVFDTPIAENAILGSAVGAAMTGLKPIVEIMWADFIFVALDQLVNQAANIRYITGGKQTAPMVVRTQQGATPGSCAQHSQAIEAMLAHVPGLKVALAATADDAYALLRAASADPDPCVVIEARSQYQIKGPVNITAGCEPVGKARTRREGSDCVIVAWGAIVNQAVAAAEELAQSGINARVLDLRWLSPLDENALVEAVRACAGKVLIVHEAVRTGGFAGEIAMRIAELCPDLPLKVQRLTTPDVRIPSAPNLQATLIPDANRIAAAAKALL